MSAPDSDLALNTPLNTKKILRKKIQNKEITRYDFPTFKPVGGEAG
jgi:hypothetical protein